MSVIAYTGHRSRELPGTTPRERTDLLVDALRRRAKVRWDVVAGENVGMVRLPGSGHEMFVRPSEVSGAYRRILGEPST